MNPPFIINRLGKLEKFSLILGRKVVVPTFELYKSPTISIDDVKKRRFSLFDRYKAVK